MTGGEVRWMIDGYQSYEDYQAQLAAFFADPGEEEQSMFNVRDSFVMDAWQTLCGVRGAHTKYLETFKVRGNKHLAAAIICQRGKLKDMSYLQNAREVSRVCANMY